MQHPQTPQQRDLTRHLGVLSGRLKVVVILLIFIIVGGVLLGGLDEVNLRASCAASAFDNVVQVNLLETVLIYRALLASFGRSA